MSDDNVRLPGPPSTRENPYKFTPEETRVLKDCNRDSFFLRCIPLGTMMGVGTYVGVNAGYLRKHTKYGATPKVVVAVILGYFIGKFSYQKVCAERLMQLPNSPIGEILRQRRKGMLHESLEPGLGPSMSLAPFIGSTEKYSDLGPSNSIDIDTTRPDNDGLNDSGRPSVDNPIYEEEMPPLQKHTTSYEELRRKNREEYQQTRTTNFRSSASAPITPQQPSEEAPVSPTRTNKYGDALV